MVFPRSCLPRVAAGGAERNPSPAEPLPYPYSTPQFTHSSCSGSSPQLLPGLPVLSVPWRCLFGDCSTCWDHRRTEPWMACWCRGQPGALHAPWDFLTEKKHFCAGQRRGQTPEHSSSCSKSSEISKSGSWSVLGSHRASLSDGSQIALASEIVPRGLRVRKCWK